MFSAEGARGRLTHNSNHTEDPLVRLEFFFSFSFLGGVHKTLILGVGSWKFIKHDGV